MKNTKAAFRVVLCSFLLIAICALTSIRINAQTSTNMVSNVRKNEDNLYLITVPPLPTRELTALSFPVLGLDKLPILPTFNSNTAVLDTAIKRRLGIRYRLSGSDDRGYDCSGFIWRVFKDAGTNFKRVPAKSLWKQFPKATQGETNQFGTLIFFRGLKHVGIVRDENTFYHASRSQGVTLSRFSGYWQKQITGYRRSPAATVSEP
ncbi:MAG TPA: C40 family peptidase [Blastocatellia bacterium]|nr:C40 family peptidase [Blastocatellia bacterium]